MKRYAETQLGEGAVEITCPECRCSIDESTLLTIVSSGVVDRLLEQGLKQAVSAARDLIACPTPDCPMRVVFHEDMDKPYFHKMWCRNCGTRFCFKCLLVLTRKQSCKCTKDIHSFIDPHTGNLVKGFGKKK